METERLILASESLRLRGLILGKNKPKEPEGVKSGTAAEGNREQSHDTWADSGTQDRDRKDSRRT